MAYVQVAKITTNYKMGENMKLEFVWYDMTILPLSLDASKSISIYIFAPNGFSNYPPWVKGLRVLRGDKTYLESTSFLNRNKLLNVKKL